MYTGRPLISVIVPVYEVEEYLSQCVESILNQSYKNTELILVDDGSPDGCPAMCDKYAATDERVRVIHKENGGLADARNAGVNAAFGKYLLFVDSDDFIAEGSLERIAEKILGCGNKDLIFLNAVYAYPGGAAAKCGHHFTDNEFQNKTKKEILQYLANLPQFHVSACAKLINRNFLAENSLFFTKGLLCEDVDWSVKLYLNSESFGSCEHRHYFYRQRRDGSIMSGFSEKRYADILFIVAKWLEAATGEYEGYKDIICLFMHHQYYTLTLLYGEVSKKNRAKYKNELEKHSWLLAITGSKKAKAVSVFHSLFGMRILSAALNIYMGRMRKTERRT